MSRDATTTDLQKAVEHGTALLRERPDLAEEQAREILKVFPGELNATVLLGRALRGQGRDEEAVEVFEGALRVASDYAVAHFELGLTLMRVGRSADAVAALRRTTELKADFAPAWNALADVLGAQGDVEDSKKARREHMRLTLKNPALVRAGGYLLEGKLSKAEAICRDVVQGDPTDVSGLRMLADIGIRLGQYRDARVMLERCLELAPDYHLARADYANALRKSQQYERALAELDKLRRAEPDKPGHLLMRASVLVQVGEFDDAIGIYEGFLARYPRQARAQMSYGHALKTVGRQREAIEAYRKAIELEPTLGESYWSLANLKTFAFEADDVASMRALLAAGVTDHEDHYHLRFALGKALEDQAEYDDAFEQYHAGNAVRRERIKWDTGLHHENLARHRALFDAGFFGDRAGTGFPAADPIFIVGLPRAGSTLLEQILASHSQVDGTTELPDIISISRRLNGRRRPGEKSRYPEIVAQLSADQRAALGAEYLERTRIQRGDAPFFIDKMPNNFAHIGLIHSILPNARIIDARRHPIGCCFSGFKQLFASGQNFTYDLEEIGRYYRDYVELMEHWDRVLPGRVLRVHYEDVVADIEGQVRRILEYCHLPFEQACVNYHDTDRAVRTASSEQVRQPIYTEGTEQWQHFEAHLAVLHEALGPALETYPGRFT